MLCLLFFLYPCQMAQENFDWFYHLFFPHKPCTGYLSDLKTIFNAYWRSRNLLFDVLAVFPLDLFSFLYKCELHWRNLTLFRLNRLIWLRKVRFQQQQYIVVCVWVFSLYRTPPSAGSAACTLKTATSPNILATMERSGLVSRLYWRPHSPRAVHISHNTDAHPCTDELQQLLSKVHQNTLRAAFPIAHK